MSPSEHVVAVASEPLVKSLAEQTRPPQATCTGDEGLRQALCSETEWVWLLGPAARPQPDALERLLDAVAPPGEPIAALVAGMVIDSTGRPMEESLPTPHHGDEAAVLRLVAHRLLPIRNAPFVNCLIHRSCFETHGFPDRARLGPYAATAWTAEVLKREPGYLAPLSVVRLTNDVAHGSRRAALAATPAMIRMIRSGTWTRGEYLDALRRLTARLVNPRSA